MPNFDRECANGSVAIIRGSWAILRRLENVPRFAPPELPAGHEVVYLSAEFQGDTFTGVYTWRIAYWSELDQVTNFYDLPAKPVRRHNFNLRYYAGSGEVYYPGKHLLQYSSLLGGWYLR